MCLKCKTEIGTLTHCFWSCCKLQKYWSDILVEMEKIFHRHLDMDLLSLILGLPVKSLPTAANRRLYNVLTFAARKNILLQWIKDQVPSLKGWRNIIFELVPLEYLTNVLHAKSDQFYQIWQPYLDLLGPELSAIIVKGTS